MGRGGWEWVSEHSNTKRNQKLNSPGQWEGSWLPCGANRWHKGRQESGSYNLTSALSPQLTWAMFIAVRSH
jgi:hypothetical protein